MSSTEYYGNHIVIDGDPLFIIDPITREIVNSKTPDKPQKISIMQYDHNSERFTFQMPRWVEGHDMELCEIVEIHYCNTGSDRTTKNYGVYRVDDLKHLSDTPETLQFSWLISEQATRYSGILSFAIKFVCYESDVDYGDEVKFRWYTGIHNAITINPSMDNGGIIVEDYIDVLGQWEQELTERFFEWINDMDVGGGGTKVTVGGVEQETWNADTKVSKSTEKKNALYGTNASGEKMWGAEQNPYPYYIPIYSRTNGTFGQNEPNASQQGTIVVATPKKPYQAANQKYVDDGLSGKVGFTDFATADKGGVIVGNKGYGLNILKNGIPSGDTVTATEYASKSPNFIISKGTLENIKGTLGGGGGGGVQYEWYEDGMSLAGVIAFEIGVENDNTMGITNIRRPFFPGGAPLAERISWGDITFDLVVECGLESEGDGVDHITPHVTVVGESDVTLSVCVNRIMRI